MAEFGNNTFIFTGFDTLQVFLRMSSERATAAMGAAIEDTLVEVFAQSQQQVPVDTGALRASGEIKPLDVDAGQIIGSIGYGASYAFYIHEGVGFQHPHGGKAHFLSDPMSAALNQLTDNLQGRVEAALVGGGVGAGSRNQGAESGAVSARMKKGGSMKSGMTHEHVTEALKKMNSYGESSKEMNRRPVFTAKGGKLHQTFERGSEDRFHYNPDHGEKNGMIRKHAPTEGERALEDAQVKRNRRMLRNAALEQRKKR